jgi:rhomboid protease GluP
MHKNIGDAYYNMSLTNKAVYHYEKAITLNDKYDEAFYNLAVILYTQESYFNAKMNIDKAIALQPDNDQYQELLLAVKERILMNS